jgi:hypothetical protein
MCARKGGVHINCIDPVIRYPSVVLQRRVSRLPRKRESELVAVVAETWIELNGCALVSEFPAAANRRWDRFLRQGYE